jgi:hypothetical protein
VHEQAAYLGTYGVKFQRYASIERQLSTVDKSNISVEYDRTTVNDDPEDFFGSSGLTVLPVGSWRRLKMFRGATPPFTCQRRPTTILTFGFGSQQTGTEPRTRSSWITTRSITERRVNKNHRL